ncbi:MAG: hypothetical protein OXG74_08475 [Acidobacteria bacterium]|nr:hypothetical protein [Acidobacteriota bacterium]
MPSLDLAQTAVFGLGRELRKVALSVAVLAAAVPVAATGSEPPWQRLEFRAKKFFLSADAAVEFDSTAPLPVADRCEGRPSLPVSAARIRIESSIFGRRSQSSLWFDAESLQAHVRVQEERGSRNRYKRYTFCQGTVEAERATPNAGEADLPVASWTHRYPLVHEVPAELTAPLSEPSALLHLVGRLAALQAEGGAASRTVPVFSNSQVLAVRIDRHPETIPAMPGFSVAGGPSPEELTLARFTLTPLAIGSDGGVEDFELLGLEGEIEILAARELQLPVSISGRLPPAGRVTVRLRHVELRENQ